MKRDLDVIRNILLQIETNDIGNRQWVKISIPEIGEAVLQEHLFLAWESGFIEGNDVSSLSSRGFKPRRLTPAGHDFLDSVRDPEIWKKTKEGANAAGGFTLELLGDIAKGFIKTQLKKQTGVEI